MASQHDQATLPDLDAEGLDRLLRDSAVPVLVDLWSEACEPCKAMAPMLGAVATDVGDRVRMVAVNLDEHPLVMGSLEVMTLPTIVVFKGGVEVERLLGLQSRADIESA